MVLFLKTTKKEKLERIDVKKSQILTFSGVLFIPKTLQADSQLVNSSFIKISVAGKNYRYISCNINSYCLDREAEEVPVHAGTEITVSYPTKLFIAKEIK
jgi:hypothetical protein